MSLTFASSKSAAIPLVAVDRRSLKDWKSGLTSSEKAWAKSTGFSAGPGEVISFPDGEGKLAKAAFGLGGDSSRARKRFIIATARKALPAGTYALQGIGAGDDLDEAALGWLLARYTFDRYKAAKAPTAQLKAPDGVDANRLQIIAAGEALSRDLINTPAQDMGPAELEAAARAVAQIHGAKISVIQSDQLVAKGFPMIHAVGRASNRLPRLIDIKWGNKGPKLTLVGKGVCFDTGGLNIKPGASMGLMKKDMGGSAVVLGLAQMIMSLGLAVQLRVLIPAVENSINGDAFRPQDVLTSRKGLTVEINNTDAEGRLVLADALALADEENPDLILSMATLTGAARVAVGPDLAPFYATSDADAAAIANAAAKVRDPVWRMPFWDPYESMIEPGIADLDNAPKGGMAGSITAALFLRRFVTDTPRYVHFDIYGWQPVAAPARPKGGVGQGARAVLEALPALLDL